MIITLPRCDDATEYLAFYSQEIIKKADSRNLKTKDLKDSKVNFSNFNKILEKLNYNLIVINGHGSVDCIYGHKHEILVKVGENEEILKDRIVYARSCEAASQLGVECVKSSQGCFIGYNIPFVFFMNPKWSANPHNDNVAKLFLSPSNLVPISLIKGNSAEESDENSKKQMLKNMKSIIKNKSEPGANLILEGLWNNFKGQVVLGNKEIKI